MKKRIAIMLSFFLIIVITVSQAASFTLPEKMYNQLAIGSGLKGTFVISAKGDRFRSEFIEKINNAVFSICGMLYEGDLHYYVFQTDEKNSDQMTALSELYRKNGDFYFRSDLVQGKTLALPGISQYLDFLFPASGENGSSSTFFAKILTLPEEERKEKWEPVLLKYQNELEIWTADYTEKAETVKLNEKSSALDFTYSIPSEKLAEKIIELAGKITKDPEAVALFDTVMTADEKNIYLNENLLFFYREALKSIKVNRPVVIKKRVSAMGDVLSYSISLPMDEELTGFKNISIENENRTTVYKVEKTGEMFILALPDAEISKTEGFSGSLWYTYINEDTEKNQAKSIAVRADIENTKEKYETEPEKDKIVNHEIEHYTVKIQQDLSYAPEDKAQYISDFIPISASIDLHYNSKYPQNSATKLQINAEIKSEPEATENDILPEDDSSLIFGCEVLTARQWQFMPFSIEGAIDAGINKDDILSSYLESWIKNADSVIVKESPGNIQLLNNKTETNEKQSDSGKPAEGNTETEKVSEESETAATDKTEQE